MTELNQANGSGPADGQVPVIPGQRAPQDTVPPGVWRGPQQATTVPVAPAADTAETDVEVDETDEPTRETWKPVRIVRTVAGHRVTRAVVRQGVYLGVGVKVAHRRRRDARSTARHERMMRAAEAGGNHEALLEWETRAAAFRKDRHERRVAMLTAPVHIARGVVIGAPVAAGVLLMVGILSAIADHHIHDVVVPFLIVAAVVRFLVAVFVFVWGITPTAAPILALAYLWHTGRSNADVYGGGWMAALKPASAETGMIVTADGIVRALQHLGIQALNTAFKTGWMPTFQLTPIREGNGYRAIFDLPLGVTPGKVADSNELLARNLGRLPIETWPSDAAQVGSAHAGCVDLWVANPGTLNKPAPEYPLLHEGTADVFEGVPAGVSPRGDAVNVQLVGNNFDVGGRMGQGKSNACRVLVLGAALDPLCEIWVFVFAGNGDFDAYTPRLARYERGTGDDVAQAGLRALYELYDEVGRRETRLAQLGAKKVTRELAKAHPDLRPRTVVFSECHELFGHKELGEEAGEVATAVLRRARKTAITLGFDTQSSRKEAIPPKIVELLTVNACFSVKSWKSNDGFLGDGSFQAGIRATVLRPGKDRGTSLITGVTDEPYEILKWYFIEVDDNTGYDAAAEVIARAMRTVDPATAVRDNAAPPAPVEERDLLADILAVLGAAESLSAADVARMLKGHAPTWRPYQKLTGKALAVQLMQEHGIKVPSTANTWPLNPAMIRKALAERPDPGTSAAE
jgi:S-DNA-T family DNA segregation ATPase FtsK/SpoIIIE